MIDNASDNSSPASSKPRSKFGYTILLVVLLSTFGLFPFIEEFGGGSELIELFVTALCLAGLYAVSNRRWMLISGILLAGLTLGCQWGHYFFPSRFLEEAALLSGSGFFGLTALAILLDVLKDDAVDFNKVSGALCVYLLMGLLWAFIYQFLEIYHPGSFNLNELSDMKGKDIPFFYYSLVTLSTLGYGDITPLTSKAASLSAMEAVFGQLYLAVLVARLVGLHIAHSLAKEKK